MQLVVDEQVSQIGSCTSRFSPWGSVVSVDACWNLFMIKVVARHRQVSSYKVFVDGRTEKVDGFDSKNEFDYPNSFTLEELVAL